METVLGLSVTAVNVQTVLVEGRDADGATLGHDALDVFSGTVSRARASEQVAEAVLSIAATDGQHLHSIGVTWSRNADLEASLVLDSLAGLGFDNVVAVQLPQAAEALARNIGQVIGCQRTAVCVVEPDAVVLSLVDTFDGEVETSVGRALDEGGLGDWISAVFGRNDWRPEALFVVGSLGGLDRLAVQLEQRLGLPVFDPPEAELALAHGAALACAYGPLVELSAPCGYPDFAVTPNSRRAVRGPVAMLAGGAVAFVVAAALVIGPHLLPERDAAPAAHPQLRADVPVRTPAPAPIAPLPTAVVELPVAVEAPEPAPEAPPPLVVQEAPDVEPPVQFQQILPPVPPPAVTPPAPQTVVVPHVPPVQQPRLRDRILDKIPGLDRLRNR